MDRDSPMGVLRKDLMECPLRRPLWNDSNTYNPQTQSP